LSAAPAESVRAFEEPKAVVQAQKRAVLPAPSEALVAQESVAQVAVAEFVRDGQAHSAWGAGQAEPVRAFEEPKAVAQAAEKRAVVPGLSAGLAAQKLPGLVAVVEPVRDGQAHSAWGAGQAEPDQAAAAAPAAARDR